MTSITNKNYESKNKKLTSLIKNINLFQKHKIPYKNIQNAKSYRNRNDRAMGNNLSINNSNYKNDLLSTDNDPFSRSVIYSNKKKHNIFSKIKNKKKTNVKNNKKFNYEKKKPLPFLNNTKKNNSDLKLNEKMKKIDEKFQKLEEKIIDKSYEDDIDHDEIIIGTNKKNVININNREDEEYEIFENNKNDFNIMYVDEYEKMINDDMLLLEIQLLYEKILELQSSYHKEFNIIINKYNRNKNMLNIILSKYKEIIKKKIIIRKIKEENDCKRKFELNFKDNEESFNFNIINNQVFDLWNNMFYNKIKKKSNNDNNKQIKELFKNILINKYSEICNKLNNKEIKMVTNLLSKYNNKYNNKSNNKIKNYPDKIKSKTNSNKVLNPYENSTKKNYGKNIINSNKIKYRKKGY